MVSEDLLGNILTVLPRISGCHAPESPLYQLLSKSSRQEIEKLFLDTSVEPKNFGPFGEIIFPYFGMGAVNSTNCFDLPELILFSFYWTNRDRYRRVADIGANIGLHSILLDRCGFEVKAYEPDPVHFEVLTRNLRANRCHKVEAINAAVSNQQGQKDFVRVLGNTTASHIAGSKSSPYGELERFKVEAEPIAPLMAWADLLKIDAEGHEKEILLATNQKDWQKTDAFVEVSSMENAEAMYSFFKKMGVTLYAQKINWNIVKRLEDMPVSYKEGSLFISTGRSPF